MIWLCICMFLDNNFLYIYSQFNKKNKHKCTYKIFYYERKLSMCSIYKWIAKWFLHTNNKWNGWNAREHLYYLYDTSGSRPVIYHTSDIIIFWDSNIPTIFKLFVVHSFQNKGAWSKLLGYGIRPFPISNQLSLWMCFASGSRSL